MCLYNNRSIFNLSSVFQSYTQVSLREREIERERGGYIGIYVIEIEVGQHALSMYFVTYIGPL